MVEIRAGDGFERYRQLFTDRNVAISKHGVVGIVEEIEGILEDIERVPWSSLDEEERYSISIQAIESSKTASISAYNDGQIEERDIGVIVGNISTKTISEALLIEESLEGSGIELMMMRLEKGTIDEW